MTSLPWFRDEDIFEAIDIAEAVMRRHGLETRGLAPIAASRSTTSCRPCCSRCGMATR